MLRFIYSAQLKIPKPKKTPSFPLMTFTSTYDVPIQTTSLPLNMKEVFPKTASMDYFTPSVLSSKENSSQPCGHHNGKEMGQERADSPTRSCWNPHCPWWSDALPSGWSSCISDGTAGVGLLFARCFPHCLWSSPPETHVQAPG